MISADDFRGKKYKQGGNQKGDGGEMECERRMESKICIYPKERVMWVKQSKYQHERVKM
jgi:hypothetical protein